MAQSETWRKKFEEQRICVIIPTYNNSKTLAGVIEDVSKYTGNIIVVNDGSTDQTPGILQKLPQVQSISYDRNRGKGWALRKGMARAMELGYAYGISFDSDGQHFGEDLPVFLFKLESSSSSIIVGSRNMNQDSVPGKSSFGRKFSNFWFHLETGEICPDTQSGLRLYPLDLLKGMRFFTRKYEFEIEVLVRASWKGIAVDSIPVKVFYAPGKDRVSHFRPFRDFTRISLLNSVLVIIAFVYIKPRDILRSLFKKGSWKKSIRDQLFEPGRSDLQKSFSVAIGVFMGIIPVWGFQMAIAIVAAIILKLNKVLVIVAANISIPPMIPLIIYFSYKAGAFWMPGSAVSIRLSDQITYHTAFYHLRQYLYGSISLAVFSGIVLGFLTFVLLKIVRPKSRRFYK